MRARVHAPFHRQEPGHLRPPQCLVRVDRPHANLRLGDEPASPSGTDGHRRTGPQGRVALGGMALTGTVDDIRNFGL